MTESETADLLRIAVRAYPGRMQVDREMVPLWASMLVDVSPQEAAAAMHEHVATNKYPPCIADIRELVAKRRQPGVDVGAALEEIRKAVRYVGTHRPPPQWSSPAIAAAVDAVGWQVICQTEEKDLGTLRAQLERYLREGVATARREANVGALEAAKQSAGALPAGDAVRAVLAQAVKPGGVS